MRRYCDTLYHFDVMVLDLQLKKKVLNSVWDNYKDDVATSKIADTAYSEC